jgi:hypothetical protein
MNRALVLVVLLTPLRGQDPASLKHARTVNLERAANLPNFVADETAKRYKSPHTDPPKWEFVDTIESEISVKGTDFRRENTRLNGKPWTKPNFPNFNWSVQFGDEFMPLFGPKCQTTIEFEGRQEAREKQLLAYRFASPPNGCFGTASLKNGFFSATKLYAPNTTGSQSKFS